MKINEVEQLVGITKRNIRFYEKEGLLSPDRADNGYRDYGEEDVEELRKIKLLRKLDIPLEEIRKMRQGELSLSDGLRRHIIHLERQRENLSTICALCQTLADRGESLPALDAGCWLEEMEHMEEGGTRFVNIRKKDIVARYAGPVAAAAAFVFLMAGLITLVIWSNLVPYIPAPPFLVSILLIVLPCAVIVGVLLALRQRIQQIRGGEEDAASQY